jgi:hypothetical protein
MEMTHCRSALLFSALAACLPTMASAMTPAEEAMFGATMPHRLLGGHGARVHLARLHGNFEGVPGNAARLLQLKELVRECAGYMRGLPVRVPTVWPDFIHGSRTDAYFSANRNITYYRAVLYAVDPRDCGLFESVSFNAVLKSTNGICHIDLIEKKARGACDASAHADAIKRVRRPKISTDQSNAVLEQLAQRSGSNRAENYRQLKTELPGVKKTILGLQCEVWNNPFDPGGTYCFSLGGSFPGSQVAHWSDHSGIALEQTSKAGMQMHAVEALLDADVDGAVFAPYLSGGYTIKDTGARR